MFNKLNPFFRYGSKFLLPSRKYNVVAPDCRLLYVNQGEAYLNLNNSQYILNQGDVFYCPAGSVYCLERYQDKETVVTVLNFDLTDKNCNDILPRTPARHYNDYALVNDAFFDEADASSCFLSDYKILYGAESFLEYFENILKTFQSEETLRRELCGCIVKTMLLKLNSAKKTKPQDMPKILKTIITYIDKNYTDFIDNNVVAELVGYHPNYIGRIFKEYMHVSLHQYLLNLKITEAKRLITETNFSFQEIAYKVGFRDYPYFSAYFKQKTGCSPTKYRKQNINLI